MMQWENVFVGMQHLSVSLYIGRTFVFGLAEHQLSFSHRVQVQFHGINVLLQDLFRDAENVCLWATIYFNAPLLTFGTTLKLNVESGLSKRIW